jgi:hypothetical protein
MGSSFVISGLKQKRARVAGEIAAAQRAIDQRREDLAQLDAVIRMFTPDCDPDMIPPIPPGSHGLFFRYRELSRLIYDMLKEAKGPQPFERIVDQIVAVKGFPMDDRHVRKHVRDTVRANLLRLGRAGKLRRVIREPDTWWELVG